MSVAIGIIILLDKKSDPRLLEKSLELGDPPTEDDFVRALNFGKVEVANWLIPKIENFKHRQYLILAVTKGNLETIQLIHQLGLGIDNDMMTTMVINDKLEMLQWIHQQGIEIPISACVAAIQYNDLGIIMWFESIYADKDLSYDDKARLDAVRAKIKKAGSFFSSLGCK